ncbi:holo-ACP synthase [Stigmatella sp. ncwal1]|uniref:Holo-[acyl-carrier-protein] synthase n=2 Tax=Stigmatella TaxID=40 RepID=Q08QH8_STIAD|nr:MULTISPECIES: holo-ACP synthase [Stigmatella]ADO72510.1 Holo-[acyl-carrier-protein] synthase [Stigmatella aurantiaca DW4/3-1]EAU62749.1 holo-(acyl-carrier-protein) synthase [Stigmatella aurantiaca DW4/3-1]MDC0708068.1 holo-ACP synthase [Stigmatella ashevillena]
MAIVGLGMDICSVERIQRILQGPRGQRFLERVYTASERALCSGRADAASAYAARFAAKEALVKALGAPPGLSWQDMEVVRGAGMPRFALSGVALEVMEQRRLDALLTMTHDAGVAAATVILQERG